MIVSANTKPSRILQDELALLGSVAELISPNLPTKITQKQTIGRARAKGQLTEPMTMADVDIPEELKVTGTRVAIFTSGY